MMHAAACGLFFIAVPSTAALSLETLYRLELTVTSAVLKAVIK
jgi:hypothetical protein